MLYFLAITSLMAIIMLARMLFSDTAFYFLAGATATWLIYKAFKR